MNKKVLTEEIISKFKEHLILEERSAATTQKYIRDVKTFADYVGRKKITKETVIDAQSKQVVMQVKSLVATPLVLL